MLPESLAIRFATEGDLPEIQRIYNDAIRTGVATWDEEPWPDEQRREWWHREHEGDPASPVLVATVDGQVAGFAYLSRMSQKSGWRYTREDTIYIDPPYHGLGIGRVLLTALLDEAKAQGLRLIVASIESANSASLALHLGLGFVAMGEMRNAGYKFERWLHTTYVQLDLHESWPPRV